MDFDLVKIVLLICQALGGILCTLIYSSYKDIKIKIENTKNELNDYKLHVAENCVTRTDIASMQATTKEMFNAMFKKLDTMDENISRMSEKFRDRLEVGLSGKQDK